MSVNEEKPTKLKKGTLSYMLFTAIISSFIMEIITHKFGVDYGILSGVLICIIILSAIRYNQ